MDEALVPEQLGDGGWRKFVCHPTDTHLIPTANLDPLMEPHWPGLN